MQNIQATKLLVSEKKANKLLFFEGSMLFEVMITSAISILVLVGLIQVFIQFSSLNEKMGDMGLAINEAHSKLEEMRYHSFYSGFNDLVTNYGPGGNPGNVFGLVQSNGVGVIYINSVNPELLEIEVVVSLLSADNRVIGEDSNLNGNLDMYEDLNGNGKLDSPIYLASRIARR